jgi:hypothetical protein
LSFLRSALIESEVNAIDILAIGLGIAPIHLHNIFPIVLHSLDISEFSSGIAAVSEILHFNH